MRAGWLACAVGVVGLGFLAGCGDDDGGGVTVDAAVDGAVVVDARVADARVIDGAVAIDAQLGNPGWAGCGSGAAAFVDRTGAGDSRVVTHVGFEFAPKCMRVKRGQTVTLPVLPGTHPLRTAANNPANDIVDTSVGSTVTFTLTAVGVYGYHCGIHGTTSGGGMAGAFDVVP